MLHDRALKLVSPEADKSVAQEAKEEAAPVAVAPSNATRSAQKLKDLLAEEAVKTRMAEKSTEATQTTITTNGEDKNPDVIATSDEEEAEDREHLIHFRTWGPVAPRSTLNKPLAAFFNSY